MLHEKALNIGLAASGAVAAKNPPNFSGHWTNQMLSTMDLTVMGNAVTGSYTSTSSGNGPPITSDDLKGFIAGDMISLLVLWPGGSMTAWVGQLVNESTAPTLRTLWHLITDIPDADEDEALWKSTLAGADEFTR